MRVEGQMGAHLRMHGLPRAVPSELHAQASAQLSSLPRQPQAPWLIS